MALPSSSRLQPVPSGVQGPLAERLRLQHDHTKLAMDYADSCEHELRRARALARDRLATYDAMLLEVGGQMELEIGEEER